MAVYNAPVKEGTSMTLGYTGVVDTLNILKNGLYKFELYGAGGVNVGMHAHGQGNYNGNGGAGGHSIGYKILKNGSVLYPCVGGQGYVSYETRGGGGFNGGGNGRKWTQNGNTWKGSAYGGGGASHIATISGTLAQIGAPRKSTILIVAGGGGAAYSTGGLSNGNSSGGGNNGGNGTSLSGRTVTGGTQSSGGVDGYAYDSNGTGAHAGFGLGSSFGRNGDNWYSIGGGGGLYGGGSESANQGGGSPYAGGGSGYIGGVPTVSYKGENYAPSMSNGGHGGNGLIIVTLVKSLAPTIYWGDREVDALYYGDQDIDALYYGDQDVA